MCVPFVWAARSGALELIHLHAITHFRYVRLVHLFFLGTQVSINMNVSLGSVSDNYDPIPLKELNGGHEAETDVELGFEMDTSLIIQNRLLDEGIAVLQVTIRRPFSVLSVMAILWSLFPYVVPLFCILSFIRYIVLSIIAHQLPWTGHAGFLFFYLLLALSGVVLNERVLKRFFQEPRPAASASKSYGMPSGHSTNCYAWMVWVILEVVLHPSRSSGLNWTCVIISLVVLAPVPYARVYVQDHTPKQVLAGCAVGTILGLFAVPLRALLFPNAVPVWIPSF